VQDDRQKLIDTRENAAEFHLLDKPPRRIVEKPAPAPAEYLESNFFIRCDDEVVRKLAHEAVSTELDVRRKLAKLKQYLARKFEVSFEVAFATADEIARYPEGDCSEMGVLYCAMCRAQGIPSRVVFGLVYDERHRGFGGHLWTEAYVDGNWEPFDPTGVLDGLRAAYLKVHHHSMKDVLNPETMVEIRRAFSGKIKVEVIDPSPMKRENP
jgi:transglutaminase-like putative cysteine protease